MADASLQLAANCGAISDEIARLDKKVEEIEASRPWPSEPRRLQSAPARLHAEGERDRRLSPLRRHRDCPCLGLEARAHRRAKDFQKSFLERSSKIDRAISVEGVASPGHLKVAVLAKLLHCASELFAGRLPGAHVEAPPLKDAA
jgi:hypothetical protein